MCWWSESKGPDSENRSLTLAAFEELLLRAFLFSLLRGRLFFNWHQFVAEPLCLPFELGLKSLVPLRVPLGPERRIIFDLVFDHRVEDDRDLLGRGRGCPRWPKLAFH